MIPKRIQTVVGYRCPHCGHGVLSPVGVLSLSGELKKLKCVCGESEMLLQETADEKIRLTVPCLICPRPHPYMISKKVFFGDDLFTLSCEMTGLDICFIGNEKEVSEALEQAADTLLAMMEESGFDPNEPHPHDKEMDRDVNFTDNHIYDMVLFVVKDLQEEGKIRCRCTEQGGDGAYDIFCADDRLFVYCGLCGARREICCNGSLSTQAFLEADSLTLEGSFEDLPDTDGMSEEE